AMAAMGRTLQRSGLTPSSAVTASSNASRHAARGAGASRNSGVARASAPVSSSVSCCSRIAILSKQSLQSLARALHPHLERRYPCAGDRRHLVVAHHLDVLEHECLPLCRVEASQRTLDRVAQVPIVARRRT